jgi:DNA replication protein DnaC
MAEQEAERILEKLSELVSGDLTRAGLSKREMRADWAKVPKLIKDSLPKPTLMALSAGRVPPKGFGIGSDTGAGKTMAVAAMLKGFQREHRKRYAEQIVERAQAHEEPQQFRSKVCWLTWPETVAEIRNHAIDGEAERIVERAENAPLLVLDDLGRERIKGSYVDDFAASQLDIIVNRRYRDELPTIWTTNLPEIDLTAIYGAALVSRLTEDAPLVWLDGLASMRIR